MQDNSIIGDNRMQLTPFEGKLFLEAATGMKPLGVIADVQMQVAGNTVPADHPLRDLYEENTTFVVPQAKVSVAKFEVKEVQMETFELLTGVCYKCFGKNNELDTVVPPRWWQLRRRWRNHRAVTAPCTRCGGSRRAPARATAGQA